MEENVNVKEIKKTIGQKIKDNKKVIIVGSVCLAGGVLIGVFGPKVVKYLINAGSSAVAEAALETGAEVAIEAAAAVA